MPKKTPVAAVSFGKRHIPMKAMFCACKSPFQDKRYGTGKRIMNPYPTTSGAVGYYCTVCGVKH